MKYLDRFIQKLRVEKALSYIPANSRVLDIGCSDGILFRLAGKKIRDGIGLDPCLNSIINSANYQLIPGCFPEALPNDKKFDVITLLAVFEHMPPLNQRKIAIIVQQYLNTSGLLVLTVPSAITDKILEVIKAIHLIDGMALEEHHGFQPSDVQKIFSDTGLILKVNKKFEFGLNNLFVYQKRS